MIRNLFLGMIFVGILWENRFKIILPGDKRVPEVRKGIGFLRCILGCKNK